ncbi:hypothetical protein Gpo141_00003277 [Globisporangium polare]
MGAKHSVPVTSTQNEGPSMPYSSFAMATARSDNSDTASSAQASEQQHHHHSSSYGKLSLNTATIRPHESAAGGSSHAQKHSAHSETSAAAEAACMTPLDTKITNALKELKKKRMLDEKDSHNPFTRILLKFPLVAKAFNSVRSTFEEFDKGKKGYIVYSDVESAFEKLGVSFSKEEIGQVFDESDMLENGKLNFKEFLVCLAIGFVLHKIPSLESERLSIFYAPLSTKEKEATAPNQALLFGEGNKLRIAFQLAVDAFLWFDIDGNGLINKDEMAMRLGTSTQLHSPTKKMSSLKERAGFHRAESSEMSINSAIWERRFNEMDWNHDGTIQFKEFLMAFESWVGLDDDDSVDEK